MSEKFNISKPTCNNASLGDLRRFKLTADEAKIILFTFFGIMTKVGLETFNCYRSYGQECKTGYPDMQPFIPIIIPRGTQTYNKNGGIY